MTPELYHPVLDCFVRGLPHVYRDVDALPQPDVDLVFRRQSRSALRRYDRSSLRNGRGYVPGRQAQLTWHDELECRDVAIRVVPGEQEGAARDGWFLRKD